MRTNKIYNFIVVALLLASGAMGTLLYMTWSRVREENVERRLDESKLLYQLNKLKKEKEYNTEYYQRLIHDEEFAGRVIREKLGYAGKDEIVFRFKDSTPLSINGSAPNPILTPQNTPKKDNPETLQPQQPQELTETIPVEKEQKSILRRLFSKENTQSKPEKEITPQIRIDLSTDKDSENIDEKTPKTVESTKEQLNQIDGLKTENLIVDEKPVQQIKKKKVSKKRTKNSIRFRAN